MRNAVVLLLLLLSAACKSTTPAAPDMQLDMSAADDLSTADLSPPGDGAGKSWVQIGSMSQSYIGSFLSGGIIERADGSRVIAFSGPAYPDCIAIPFVGLRVDSTGALTSFTLPAPATAPIHAREMVVADFNGDGVDDFFSANHGCDKPPFPGELANLYLSSGSAYVDKSSTLPPLVGFIHSVAVGDLRKVGKLDILVGVLGMTTNAGLPAQYMGANTRGTDVGPYLLRGDGAGNFTYDNTSLPDRVAAYPFPVDGTTPGRFTSSLLVDLDGDGYPDLVLGGEENSMSGGSVYLNDQAGGFKTTEHPLPVGLFGASNTITVDVLATELDGNGKLDLLLSQTPSAPMFYDGGKVQVLTNQGGGVFLDETDKYLPNQKRNKAWAQFLHLVDLDDDGNKDLLLQIEFPDGADVIGYRSGASGIFAELPRTALPPAVVSLVPLRFPGRNVLASVKTNPAGTHQLDVQIWERR